MVLLVVHPLLPTALAGLAYNSTEQRDRYEHSGYLYRGAVRIPAVVELHYPQIGRPNIACINTYVCITPTSPL